MEKGKNDDQTTTNDHGKTEKIISRESSETDIGTESSVSGRSDARESLFLRRYDFLYGAGVTPSVSAIGVGVPGGSGGSCLVVGTNPADLLAEEVYGVWFSACLVCDAKPPSSDYNPVGDDLGPMLLCPSLADGAEAETGDTKAAATLSQARFFRFCAVQGLVGGGDGEQAAQLLFEAWVGDGAGGGGGGRLSSKRSKGLSMGRGQFVAFCAATWGSPAPVSLKLMRATSAASVAGGGGGGVGGGGGGSRSGSGAQQQQRMQCGALERELACRRIGQTNGGSFASSSGNASGGNGANAKSKSMSSNKPRRGLSPRFVLPVTAAHGISSSSSSSSSSSGGGTQGENVAEAVASVWPQLAPLSATPGTPSPLPSRPTANPSSSFAGALAFAPCGRSLEDISRFELAASVADHGGGVGGFGSPGAGNRPLVLVQQLLRSTAACLRHLHEQKVVLSARGCGLHPVIASGLSQQTVLLADSVGSAVAGGSDLRSSSAHTHSVPTFAHSGPSTCLPPARCFVRAAVPTPAASPGAGFNSGRNGGGSGDTGSGSGGGRCGEWGVKASSSSSGGGGCRLVVRDLESSAKFGESVALPPWAIASAVAVSSADGGSGGGGDGGSSQVAESTSSTDLTNGSPPRTASNSPLPLLSPPPSPRTQFSSSAVSAANSAAAQQLPYAVPIGAHAAPEVAWYACASHKGLGVGQDASRGAPVLAAAPSLDAWALGFMAFELVSGRPLVACDVEGRLVGGAKAARRLSSWGHADTLNAVASLLGGGGGGGTGSGSGGVSVGVGGVAAAAAAAAVENVRMSRTSVALTAGSLVAASASALRMPGTGQLLPSAASPWNLATPLGLLCELLTKLLDPLPGRRPSMAECLSHPFFALDPAAFQQQAPPHSVDNSALSASASIPLPLYLCLLPAPLREPPVFLPPVGAASQDMLARLNEVLLKGPLSAAFHDHLLLHTTATTTATNTSAGAPFACLAAAPPSILLLTQRLEETEMPPSPPSPSSSIVESQRARERQRVQQQAMLWFDAFAALGEGLNVSSSAETAADGGPAGAGAGGGSAVQEAAELPMASSIAGRRVDLTRNERMAPFGCFSGEAGAAAAYGQGTRRSLFVYVVDEVAGEPVGASPSPSSPSSPSSSSGSKTCESGSSGGGAGKKGSGSGGGSTGGGYGALGSGDGDLVLTNGNTGGAGGFGCLELVNPAPSDVLALLPFARLGLKAVASIHGANALERLFFPNGLPVSSMAATDNGGGGGVGQTGHDGALDTAAARSALLVSVADRCDATCGSLEASGSRIEFDALLIACQEFTLQPGAALGSALGAADSGDRGSGGSNSGDSVNPYMASTSTATAATAAASVGSSGGGGSGGGGSAAVKRKAASAARRAGCLAALATAIQRHDPLSTSVLASAVLCRPFSRSNRTSEQGGGPISASSPLGGLGFGGGCPVGRVVWAARGSAGHGGGEGSGLPLVWSEPLWAVHGGAKSLAVPGFATLGIGAAHDVGLNVQRCLGSNAGVGAGVWADGAGIGARRRRAGLAEKARAARFREETRRLDKERRGLQIQLEAVTARLQALEESGCGCGCGCGGGCGGGGGGTRGTGNRLLVGAGGGSGGGGLLDAKTKDWLEQRHEELLESQAAQAETVSDGLGRVQQLLELLSGSSGDGDGDSASHRSSGGISPLRSNARYTSGQRAGGGGGGGVGGETLSELRSLRKLVASGPRAAPMNADDLFRDNSPGAASAAAVARGRAPPPRKNGFATGSRKKGKSPPPAVSAGRFGKAAPPAKTKASSGTTPRAVGRSHSMDEAQLALLDSRLDSSDSLQQGTNRGGVSLDFSAMTDVSQLTSVSSNGGATSLTAESLDEMEGRMDKVNQVLGEMVVEQITEQMIELMNEQMNHQAAQHATHALLQEALGTVENLEQNVAMGLNKNRGGCMCSLM